MQSDSSYDKNASIHQSKDNFVLQLKPATHFGYSTQLKHVDGFICKTKCEERIPTRYNNTEVYCQLQMLIIDYCLNMFRASLMPNIRRKDHVLLRMVFVLDVAGSGFVMLRCRV